MCFSFVAIRDIPRRWKALKRCLKHFTQRHRVEISANRASRRRRLALGFLSKKGRWREKKRNKTAIHRIAIDYRVFCRNDDRRDSFLSPRSGQVSPSQQNFSDRVAPNNTDFRCATSRCMPFCEEFGVFGDGCKRRLGGGVQSLPHTAKKLCFGKISLVSSSDFFFSPSSFF